MTASQHTIAGTVLTMPVKVRKATQHMAMFSVDADAAQRMIDYSGLRAARYLPGRAAVALILAHFIDGDLGEYHEFSTSVMVSPPGSSLGLFTTCWSIRPSLWKLVARSGAFRKSCPTSRFMMRIGLPST